MTVHASIPWDFWRKEYLLMRRRLFSKDPPDGPYVLVDAEPRDIVVGLGNRGYTPQWALSYNKGEDVNLAFQFYDDLSMVAPRADWHRTLNWATGGLLGTVTYEPVEWWQYHFRGWCVGDGVLMSGHFEAGPRHEDSAHIDGVGFDRGEGMRKLREELGTVGIRYEEYDGPPPRR